MLMKPNYIFTSARLGMRPWQDADLTPFAAMNAHPEVMRHFPNLLTSEQSQQLIQRIMKGYEQYGYCFYATDLLETGEFIGFIGFMYQTFESHFTPCVEIGWRLDHRFWNKGLATEGAKACLDYGFNQLGFTSVYSFTATCNNASERIMQKIGMQKIGEFEHPRLEKGHHLRPHVLYKTEQ